MLTYVVIPNFFHTLVSTYTWCPKPFQELTGHPLCNWKYTLDVIGNKPILNGWSDLIQKFPSCLALLVWLHFLGISQFADHKEDQGRMGEEPQINLEMKELSCSVDSPWINHQSVKVHLFLWVHLSVPGFLSS